MSVFLVLSNELERDWLMQEYRFAMPLLRHLQWRSQRYCGKWPLQLRAAPEPCNILWAHYLDGRWFSRVSVAYQLLIRSISVLLLALLCCLGAAISGLIWWQLLGQQANLAMQCSIWSPAVETIGSCQCFCLCEGIEGIQGGCETWKAPLGVLANWCLAEVLHFMGGWADAVAHKVVAMLQPLIAWKCSNGHGGAGPKCFSFLPTAWVVAIEAELGLSNIGTSFGSIWRKPAVERGSGVLSLCHSSDWTLVFQPLAGSHSLWLGVLRAGHQSALHTLEAIRFLGTSDVNFSMCYCQQWDVHLGWWFIHIHTPTEDGSYFQFQEREARRIRVMFVCPLNMWETTHPFGTGPRPPVDKFQPFNIFQWPLQVPKLEVLYHTMP